MSSERLLPSEQARVQAVADRLLGGDRLLVRGLLRSGKTLLAAAVSDVLGETAFYFDGAAITEENQAEQHARLQAEVNEDGSRRSSCRGSPRRMPPHSGSTWMWRDRISATRPRSHASL